MAADASFGAGIGLSDLIRVVESNTGDPIGRVREAVEMARHLGELADHLVGHFVDEARREGASWTQIGDGLGVSKQAVQKRFVPPRDPAQRDERVAWERFTPRVRNLVTTAKRSAVTARNGEVLPTHLLVALTADSTSVAATALQAHGVTLDAVERVAASSLPDPASGELAAEPTLSRLAHKALALATRHSLRLRHSYIGTEHVLLALHDIDETNNLLRGLGITPETTELEVQRALRGHPRG